MARNGGEIYTGYFDFHGVLTRTLTNSEMVDRALAGFLRAFPGEQTKSLI